MSKIKVNDSGVEKTPIKGVEERKAYVEKYKLKNPVKYAHKEAELERWIETGHK